jgi:hypothetical protein
LQFVNDSGEFAPLLDQAGNDIIFARGHAIRRRSDRSGPIAAIATSHGTSCLGSALACSELQRGELLSTDEIAGRVMAVKGFDSRDAILSAAIRDQVGSTVKRLHR